MSHFDGRILFISLNYLQTFYLLFFVCRLSFNRSAINLLFYIIILLLILLRSRIVIGFLLGLRVNDFKT